MGILLIDRIKAIVLIVATVESRNGGSIPGKLRLDLERGKIKVKHLKLSIQHNIMLKLEYNEEETEYGKMRIYDTSDIPYISTYLRIYTEKKGVAFPLFSYKGRTLYSIQKGRASLVVENNKVVLGNREVVIVMPEEQHSIIIEKDGVVDIIRFKPTKDLCLAEAQKQEILSIA